MRIPNAIPMRFPFNNTFYILLVLKKTHTKPFWFWGIYQDTTEYLLYHRVISEHSKVDLMYLILPDFRFRHFYTQRAVRIKSFEDVVKDIKS